MASDALMSKTINCLRFPLTVGVVFIHFSLSKGLNIHGKFYGVDNPDWYFFITTFVSDVLARLCVPTFFFISGFLFYYSKAFNTDVYKQKLRTRIKSLLIPFILWNIIAIFCTLGKSYIPGISTYYPPVDIHLSFLRIFNTFFCNANNSGILVYPSHIPPSMLISPINIPLWYVRDLMLMVVLSPIIYWMIKKFGLFTIIINGCLWFFASLYCPGKYITMFFYALFFFSWGASYSINKEDFLSSFRKMSYIPFLYLILAIIDTQTKDSLFNTHVHLLTIPFGVVSIFIITSYLLEHGKIREYNSLSKCSFFVFACHTLFMGDAGKFAFRLLHIPDSNPIAMLSFYFAVPIATIAICCTLHNLLYRFSPYACKLLTGGR